MKGLFWSPFQRKLVSFNEWMKDAEKYDGIKKVSKVS